MRIEAITRLETIIEKLERKHSVSVEEVEEVLSGRPHFRRVEQGHRRGEDVYAAIGMAREGRPLIVFFVYKPKSHEALVVSVRELTPKERDL